MTRDEAREVLRVLERNTYAAMQEARLLLQRFVDSEHIERENYIAALPPDDAPDRLDGEAVTVCGNTRKVA